eukprot:TRINITY_DN11371_c0_g1_i1.p1 TRINITY_DN11371_c0_g1~~TRINITY_DN11371_c0_g1_i1.p1  ORF type:complete len:111 (+),score=5.08 TRINITY_DN11371_c0_g1_i1:217-549(+)
MAGMSVAVSPSAKLWISPGQIHSPEDVVVPVVVDGVVVELPGVVINVVGQIQGVVVLVFRPVGVRESLSISSTVSILVTSFDSGLVISILDPLIVYEFTTGIIRRSVRII